MGITKIYFFFYSAIVVVSYSRISSKWVKLRESHIRGPPRGNFKPTKFSDYYYGNFGVQITNPSLDF